MFEQRSNIFSFCRFAAAACLAVLAGCAGRGHVADSGSTVAAPAAPAAPASLKIPVGFAATAGSARVSLTWSASSSASSYHVKRATVSGGPYTQIGAPTSTTYTDSALTNGTRYYYVVSALDPAGESANSAQVSAVPAAPAAPRAIPTAPTGLSAAKGSGQVTLSWSASSGAISYHVKRGAASDGPYTQVGAPTSASYTDATVTNGTTYFYVVSAVNSAGESANSAPVSTAPSVPPVQGTPPALVPGVWTNITPPAPGLSSTYGTAEIEIDPNNHAVLYAAVDQNGLWKSTNYGSTWVQLGKPPAVAASPANNYTTPYLDSPIEVRIDPNDSTHLIATQGVRGTALGFWVSHNSGATWTMPTGFYTFAATTTEDVTQMAVDPSNFNHILVGSHSAWPGLHNAGIMETTDGGNTWVAHPPLSSWSSGSLALNFLYDIPSGQGNSNTWLVGDWVSDGMWRTTDGGKTFTQVTSYTAAHGGGSIWYASDGTIYAGSTPFPVYSKDNGLTWAQVHSTGLAYSYYYSVVGDGNTLYTMPSSPIIGGYLTGPFLVTSESTGTTSAWSAYQGSTQTFNNGPFVMRYDPTNGLMYSANWGNGLWVLKVIKP
jgi:hypothetical protein